MFGALFIVGLFTYKYFTVYVTNDPKNMTVAVINAVVHIFLITMLTWSLLATYCTDPGYVKSFFLSLQLPPTPDHPLPLY